MMIRKNIAIIGVILIMFIAGFSIGSYGNSDEANTLEIETSKPCSSKSRFDALPAVPEETGTVQVSSFSDEGKLPMDDFAESGDTNGRVFHLWDLASAKPENFDKIFDKSLDPDITKFRGVNYQGIVLSVNYLAAGNLVFTMYTGNLIDFLTGTMFSQALTFQKRFYPQDNDKGESGINYWPVHAEEAMHMKIYMSPSIQDATIQSLKIDYDVSSNNRITHRPLIDEVRQIPGSDLYIGKMYYRLADSPMLFLWFAIEL
jgi:hypothetical protein